MNQQNLFECQQFKSVDSQTDYLNVCPELFVVCFCRRHRRHRRRRRHRCRRCRRAVVSDNSLFEKQIFFVEAAGVCLRLK